MDIKKETIQAVFYAIDEVNQILPPDQQVPKSLETVLTGSAGALDSLGLVNFIVETEQQIEAHFGVTVNLADQRAADSGQNPIHSIETLVDYLSSLIALELEA